MSALPPILAQMKSLGHAVFDGPKDFDLNLFGIRTNDNASGEFNDLLGCAYKERGEWHVRYWAATTDPGVYYRENPMNVNGTAILVPGQYRSVYKIDGHGSTKYSALCQRNGTVRCYRDSDKDDILDMDPASISEGWYGINLHASSMHPYDDNRDRREGGLVKNWSAGCQVHATSRGFREMMALARKQVEVNGWDTFTYTLMTQWW